MTYERKTGGGGGGGVSDHGALTGLSDDDHPYVLETSYAARVDNPGEWSADLGDDYEFNGSGSTLPTGWSWVNQGTATYTEEFGAGRIDDPAHTGYQWRALVRAVPAATPWLVTCKLSFGGRAATDFYASMVLRESGTGELQTLDAYRAAAASTAFYVSRWSSPTAFVSTPAAGITPVGTYESVLYMRIRKNSATSWDFEVSSDGLCWGTVLAGHDASAFLTPDQIGFGLNVSNNIKSAIACHWYRARGA